MGESRGLSRAVCLLLASWPGMAWAQVPAGPEFQVNTYTYADQFYPTVAVSRGGDFVVAWGGSAEDGSGVGVFGQRFASSGLPKGTEFKINTYTTNSQSRPTVTSDAAGRFVVAWTSQQQDYSFDGVFGRRFAAAGAPLDFEFQINTYTTGFQNSPSVAMGPAGDFVVAWTSPHPQDVGGGIFAQRYDASGTPQGTEFHVNTYTTSGQSGPSVSMDAAGNFVVTWHSFFQDGGYLGVFGQRLDSSGAPRGTEFRVNTYTTGNQLLPSVAMDPAGNFVVVWSGYVSSAPFQQVFGQRYDASGAPQGSEFAVQANSTAFGSDASVAMDSGGNFVVVWNNTVLGSLYPDVVGRRFDLVGTPRGAEFLVNTYTTGYQSQPSLSMDAVGNFTVAWQSLGQLPDGSSYDVFAQRFGGLLPAALAVDGPVNGVWEPGETAEVKPTWRNVNGSAQTIAGGLRSLSGPLGALYAITDSAATYGTIPNGGSAACTDCYGVAVSNPPTRPVQHWDATAVETITPDAQGQVKRWTLHIGRSFADVPTTNPFYRFVETLLHYGVTGGCGGPNYCPANATTRDQMSVFVLVAREGAGYTPSPCTAPVFNDVPASNPFCRFIEELFRRGVVGGCGSGSYCPASPVTRDQMSVFVLRTLDPTLSPPACVAGSERFADVAASNPFCKWIEELARRGVVTGCGGGNYCPTASVTREQMGVFISSTFSLALYGP